MTGKQKIFANAYLDRNSKTYLNQTESALAAYNAGNRQRAAEIGSQQLKNTQVINYIEKQAVELGIGIVGRLSNYGEIATAHTPRQTVQKKYKRNTAGHLELVSKTVTSTPVKDSDRIKAMQQIDTLTGTKEQREIDRQQAMSEYDALYDRMVGNIGWNTERNIGSNMPRDDRDNAHGNEPKDARTRTPGGKGPAPAILQP